MEKEKAIFIETRIREIIADTRNSILENARLEISESKETIADYLDYVAGEGEEFEFTRSISGVMPSVGEKIKADRKAGKDFGECLDEITPSELLQFIGMGQLRMASLRERFPNAFRPWTAELDGKLEAMWCEGMSYKELSEAFGRNENAIKVRVVALELERKYGERPEGPLSVKVRY